MFVYFIKLIHRGFHEIDFNPSISVNVSAESVICKWKITHPQCAIPEVVQTVVW
jgi:hypothetical protein